MEFDLPKRDNPSSPRRFDHRPFDHALIQFQFGDQAAFEDLARRKNPLWIGLACRRWPPRR
jgi:hypothetical protein